MMYAVLPTGSFHGWGVCGKYIAKELSRLTPLRLVTEGFDPASIQDAFDYRLLKSLLVPDQEQQNLRSGVPVNVD
ncbi:MAG: hypothetical protein IT282_07550, partial [Bacteroidetes bacterium]|nr:hypothetical protein [Bacteroidota bacterium]